MNRILILTVLGLTACGHPFDPTTGGMDTEIMGAVEITGAAWLADEYTDVSACLGLELDMGKHRTARYFTAERITVNGEDAGGVRVAEYLYMDASYERWIMRHEMLHYITGLRHGAGFKDVEYCVNEDWRTT